MGTLWCVMAAQGSPLLDDITEETLLSVQRNERAMERLIPRDIRARLAASLLELADGLGEPTEGGVVIGVRMIHQTLADMAVSSRVGVSEEMARFRREGLIEPRGKGRIVLVDKLSLEEIARNQVV